MQESRKHHDTLLPNQKSPVPLNRFRPHGSFCAFLSIPFPQVRGRELAGQRGNLPERGQETGRLQNGCPRHLQLPGAEQQRALVQEGGRDLYQETGWTKTCLYEDYVGFQVDSNWYEGERNAMLGIFPTTYVEIIPQDAVASQVQLEPFKDSLSHVLLQCR